MMLICLIMIMTMSNFWGRKMIRRARKTDFPFVYPILKQIFDEMQMKSIESFPEDQFYSLMKLGFISEDYRYSYRRIWVAEDHGRWPEF